MLSIGTSIGTTLLINIKYQAHSAACTLPSFCREPRHPGIQNALMQWQASVVTALTSLHSVITIESCTCSLNDELFFIHFYLV